MTSYFSLWPHFLSSLPNHSYQALVTLALLLFLKLPSMFPAQGCRTCHSLCLNHSSPKCQRGLLLPFIQAAAHTPPPLAGCCFHFIPWLCFLPSTHHPTLYYAGAYCWCLSSPIEQKPRGAGILFVLFTTVSLMPGTVFTHSKWNLYDLLKSFFKYKVEEHT